MDTDTLHSEELLSLYEHKIMPDRDYPVDLLRNHITKKGMYFYPHWHEHIEMHYVRAGSTVITCGQERFAPESGELVIVNSNELHTGTQESGFTDVQVLIFDYSYFARNSLEDYILFQPLIKRDDTIGRLFDGIFREDAWREPGYLMAIKGRVYELIVYLARNYTTERLTLKENAKRNRDLMRLNTVLKFIERNYEQPIPLSVLANQANLSEYRFSHLFKEVMNQSPANYVNEIRIKRAARLLTESDMSIAEVAAYVGFNDFNNFGRQFRNFYGCPPSELRRNPELQKSGGAFNRSSRKSPEGPPESPYGKNPSGKRD